jgi:hypothetical protein
MENYTFMPNTAPTSTKNLKGKNKHVSKKRSLNEFLKHQNDFIVKKEEKIERAIQERYEHKEIGDFKASKKSQMIIKKSLGAFVEESGLKVHERLF